MKQDTLVTSYYKAQNFFLENQAKILIGVFSLAVVIVAVILYSNNMQKNNQIASGLLSKVVPIYEEGKFNEAIDGQKTPTIMGLKEIVDKYGSTEQGESAKIFLANSYYNTGKIDQALDVYNDYGGSNPVFQATALAGEAACYADKQEYGQAGELYKKAAKISQSDPSNADYLLLAGINLMKIDKNEDAKVLFETIKKDYKLTTAAQQVEKYLVQLQS